HALAPPYALGLEPMSEAGGPRGEFAEGMDLPAAVGALDTQRGRAGRVAVDALVSEVQSLGGAVHQPPQRLPVEGADGGGGIGDLEEPRVQDPSLRAPIPAPTWVGAPRVGAPPRSSRWARSSGTGRGRRACSPIPSCTHPHRHRRRARS